jgi:hypothetical protein
VLLFQGFLNDYDFVSYDHGPIIVIGDRATAHPLPPQADGLAHSWCVRDGKALVLEESYDVPVVQAFMQSLAD